jgi:hypothetical protein
MGVESPKPKTQNPKKFQIPSANIVVSSWLASSQSYPPPGALRTALPYHRGKMHTFGRFRVQSMKLNSVKSSYEPDWGCGFRWCCGRLARGIYAASILLVRRAVGGSQHLLPPHIEAG